MSEQAGLLPNPFEDPSLSGGESRRNSDPDISAEASLPGSAGPRPREKKRVGFTGGNDPDARHSRHLSPPSISPVHGSGDLSAASTAQVSPEGSRHGSISTELPGPIITLSPVDRSHLPVLSPQQTLQIHRAFEPLDQAEPIARPRPAIRRSVSHPTTLPEEEIEGPDETGQRAHRRARAQEAFERGKRLEEDEKSAPPSRQGSPERKPRPKPEHIMLDDLKPRNLDDYDSYDPMEKQKLQRAESLHHAEAHELVRQHARGNELFQANANDPLSGFRSAVTTPTEEKEFAHDYRPPPEKYRGGVLGSLLKLYGQQSNGSGDQSRSSSVVSLGGYGHKRRRSSDLSSSSQPSPPASAPVSPSSELPAPSWFTRKHKNHSTSSLAHLIGSSASLGTPAVTGMSEQVPHRLRERRSSGLGHRVRNSATAFNRFAKPRSDERARITNHIADTIARQRYLMRLCRALMLTGAPTHRLEEYMTMSARVLEVDAQFLYIPGSMIMSFDDATTHTTEVKLVKVAQGLDLGRLRDVHEVYKEVVHDLIGVEEATHRLKEIMGKKPKYSRLLRIPVFGLAAACVGPFAFSARLIDLPMAFILGCILGWLQLVVAPASDLYANVFEIAAAVILSFLSRALGSIPYKGGRLFCFSALAQSSIALILPGYIVLCASLELQSKNLVAGSVRMVYAIIYSLFLGFGLTVGISIYGLLDSNATSESVCPDPMPAPWFFFFVPVFAICLAIINHAKWKQMPAMVIIAFAAYVVNYYSGKRFAGNTQISSTLGALVIGVLANLYSRLGSRVENWALDKWEDVLRPKWRRLRRLVVTGTTQKRITPKNLEEGGGTGSSASTVVGDNESVFVRQGRRVGYSLAAAAMLPAIFVMVPSGLGIEGSLVAGIDSANQIVGNATNGTTVVNTTTLATEAASSNGISFDVGYGVIQVAIGITVGLFLSAIVVYPVGKKRSGLFSF